MYTAADFAPYQPTDPLRPHRPCRGSGLYATAAGPAYCFGCSSTGKVYSPADRRRAEEQGRRRSALRASLRERAESRSADVAFDVAGGYGLLEYQEPDRLPALYASLANGQIDKVMDALVAYWRDDHAGHGGKSS